MCGGPSQPAEPLLCPQDIQHTEEFLIKPESRVAQLDTSQWPLLLKVRGVRGEIRARPGCLPAPSSLCSVTALLCSLPRAVLAAGPRHVRAGIGLQSWWRGLGA